MLILQYCEYTRSEGEWRLKAKLIFPVLCSLPHQCGATGSACIHCNLSCGPNMVIQQAEYVWLFSSKVTNSTPSLNQIAPREISDIISYTFLTSLGRRCTELWNNKPCRLNGDTHEPKKTTPRKERQLIYQDGDIMDPDCATFTEERRKKLGCYPTCFTRKYIS